VGDGFALTRDELYWHLKRHNVHARRYFYPLITDFPMYRGLPSAHPSNLPVAKDVSARVLCLPIYPDLLRSDQERVIELIQEAGQ
jgi:dTDP-4-amino-4,6-dideoxygalactose transaminase